MRRKMRSGFCCSPEHGLPSSRRDFLYVGLLGSLGLTLGDWLKLEARAAEPNAGAKEGGRKEPAARSVIQIYLPGGIAAQETFDPKIYAPIEYRGPLASIQTKLPGVHFSEHLKQTAAIADKIAVVRSMTHGEAA